MKHHGTNWGAIALWTGIVLGIAAVFVFNLPRIWLFAIAMVACHLGHRSMMGGKHH